MVIVVMEPVIIRRPSGGFAGVDLRVRPFLRERAIEPFHLAIGLRPVRASETMRHVRAERLREDARTATRPVIGHYPGHLHACIREEVTRSFPERCRGLLFFIGEDLRVGQARVIINSVMQERIPEAPLLVVPVPNGAAEHAVPATIRDPTQLFDIHMHQLARSAFLVAHDRRLSNRQSGRAINVGEFRHPIPGEDTFYRGAWDTQVVTDAVWAPLPGEPERDDAMLLLPRQPGRRVVRAG